MVDNNHSGSTCNPIKYLLDIQSAVTFRAGGNGTASTAMAVPVLREKNGVASTLTYAWVIEWPLGPLRAVCYSLGHLRGLLCTFSSLQGSKVAKRELRLLYIYSVT